MNLTKTDFNQTFCKIVLITLIFAPLGMFGQNEFDTKKVCENLPDYYELSKVLKEVVKDPSGNGGLGNDMWATLVNRDGIVCGVTFSGEDRESQWPGSRIISAQKANTANAFSLPKKAGGALPGLSLSTANLYSAVQSGGSLFGLQFSNPINLRVGYRGDPKDYGSVKDPMSGRKIGGINVFGGGLALYDKEGNLLGALGVSGDTSCTDHVIAWKMRDALNLDYVPVGLSPTGDDNIIFDMKVDPSTGLSVSQGGFGHPQNCPGAEVMTITKTLPQSFPIGSKKNKN